MCIGEPAANGYGMLGVENVRGRRVVDDNCFTKVSSNLREVLENMSVFLRSDGIRGIP